MMMLRDLAKAVHGEINGEWINIRGAGHGASDRSLGFRLDRNAPDGFLLNSFAGDDATACRAHVKALLQKAGSGKSPIVGENTKEADGSAVQARINAALKIWDDTLAPSGTPVEIYFRARGLIIELPGSIRFHPALRHPRSRERWPAMVALVTHAIHGGPTAILRTFLSWGGRGKAPIEPQKMMLGTCRGGVVRLSPKVSNSLMVGEGIETCLTVMQATGRPVWAAISTSGLRSLELPANVHEVVILADGDEPGEDAARNAANRWLRQGRRVRIARPPRGLDFNDWLLGR
jgi:hypothetical protein